MVNLKVIVHIMWVSIAFLTVMNMFLSERAIQAKLRELNKPPVTTIYSEDGDIIDCVKIYEQPAFDHPLLKNHTIHHTIQAKLKHDRDKTNKTDIIDYQLWRKKGHCPENTIPIRRILRKDVLRYASIGANGQAPDSAVHNHAVVHLYHGEFYGSKSRISIWKPSVAAREEFSLAQTWVVNGDMDSGLNSLESGWQIYPAMYGDNNPRLFIFWTSDSYRKIRCYNLDRPGFVQVNRDICIGASLMAISTYNGQQVDFDLTIQKDQETGDWWLKFDDHLVGYWPTLLVPKLSDSADHISWGGEIAFGGSGKTHTATQMGSGHFAQEGYKKAAFIKNMASFDQYGYPMQPTPEHLDHGVTRPKCYNLSVGSSQMWGTYIFYGGPGYNPQCVAKTLG